MEKFDHEGSFLDLELELDLDPALHAPQDASCRPEHWPLDDAAPEPPRAAEGAAISGTQLRRRLITPEAIALTQAEEPRPSLLQRLLGKR